MLSSQHDSSRSWESSKAKIEERRLNFPDVDLEEMLLYLKVNSDKTEGTHKLRAWYTRRTRTGGRDLTKW